MISLIPHYETTKEIYRNIGLMSTLVLILILILKILRIKLADQINKFSLLPLILIGGIMIQNIFWKDDWVTQEILFRHGHLSHKTIEVQIKDLKSDKHDQRIIERTKYLNIIQKVNTVDTNNIGLSWIRVDEIYD